MKIVTLIARVVLGLLFTVFGANGFLHFIPQPAMPDNLAGQFLTVLIASHYIVAVCALQFAGGVLLLLNRFVPIALVLLGPILVNIILYHVFLDPAGIPPGIVACVLWFVIFWRVRSAFAGLFVMRNSI